MTFDQSVSVVGVGVAGVPVPVGLAATVGVVVAVGVPPVVGVEAEVAPSSRKTSTDFPHQWSFASGTCEGVAIVGVADEDPPKFRPVHEIKRKLVKINRGIILKPRLK